MLTIDDDSDFFVLINNIIVSLFVFILPKMSTIFFTTTIDLHSTSNVSTTDVHNLSTPFSFIHTFLQNTLSDVIQPSLFAAIGVLYDPHESVEKTSVEKTSVEKTSVDKTSVDKTSVDKTSVEKTSVDKTSVDKTSVDKTSVENEKTIISTSFDKQCYDTRLFQRGPMELHGLS